MSIFPTGATMPGTASDVFVSSLAAVESRLDLENPRALYDFLSALYYNVDEDIYNDLDEKSGKYKGIRGYRNPVHAIVEFYVAVVFPGSLKQAHPLSIPANAPSTLEDRINDVWNASNWRLRKQLYVRQSGMLGDVFLQSAIRRNSRGVPTAAYMSLVDPRHVTNFDVDDRGFLTYVRTDVPRARRQGNLVVNYWRTEEWSKARGTVRRWEAETNRTDHAVEELTGLVFDRPLADFGIDFVPFVHGKFVDDGFPRGLAAAMMSILKSAEVSRMVTELHEKLWRYNQPDQQLIGVQRDPDGYVTEPTQLTWNQATTRDVAGYKRVAVPPAGYKLEPMVGNVDYGAHQDAIRELQTHIYETDAPELAWYQRNDTGESGRALRIKLIPAIARAEEVRGNLEQAVIQATQMCLTLAQVNELPQFSEDLIGTFESGNRTFEFEERDVIPMDEAEELELMERRTRIAEAMVTMGVPLEYVQKKILKIPPEDLDTFEEQVTAEQAGGLALEAQVEELPTQPSAAALLEQRLTRGEVS